MIEILIIIALALGIGLALSYAAHKLDEYGPMFEKVRKALPGVNCGACGFQGCDDYARNVIKTPGIIGRCVPGGKDVADKLSKILDVEKKEAVKRFAVTHCIGGKNCKDHAEYEGIKTCRAAHLLGGQKSCTYGCLGFADCVNACKYGALKIGKEGYPVVDLKKCVACGACERACPRDIMKVHKKNGKFRFVTVQCMSHDTGKAVVPKCSKGCIACGICEQNCPKGAIKVIDNLATIDYDKCIGCGICVEKCPRKVISLLENIK